MKTLLTFDQFSKIQLAYPEYKNRDAIEASELAAKVTPIWPCEVLYDVNFEDGKYYFERCYVYLKHDTLKFTISYSSYNKKYSIYCESLRDFKNVSNYTVNDIERKLTKPNQIGVLTAKKIQQWVDYYETVYKQLKQTDETNGNKKAEFLQSIAGLPVKWYNNNKNGEIIKNGIKFSFEISETFVSTRIELDYGVNSDLNAFLKLSDNQFRK